MAKGNRNRAIQETLKWEGGYSNHHADNGGPTNWGITIADARKYWKADATASDVRAMPRSVAVSIYRKKYWTNPYYNCDDLPSGVDLAVYDFGVNSGPKRAWRFYQSAKAGTDHQTIVDLCDARLAWLKTLDDWPHFGKGWTSRVKGVKRLALEWEAGKSPDAKKKKAKTAAAGAAGTAAGVDAGNTAKDTIDQTPAPTPETDVTDIIVDNAGVVVETVTSLGLMDQVIAVLSNPRFLVAAAVVAVCIGIIYWQWRRNRA